MQNAWRFVDDEVLRERLKEAKGIGTPATRAEIIGGLKKQGFLIGQGKHIVPTEGGMSLFGVLKQADPALVDPGVTAQLAMQNAWRFVDDEVLRERLKEAKGIGTPATRAEIIGGLKKQGFLIGQGKHIVPTEGGMSLFGVLKQADPALVDPGVTAQLDACSTMSLSASRRWSARLTNGGCALEKALLT